jgi:phosphoglycolate phosphatase
MDGLFDLICGAGDQGQGNAKWQILRRAMDCLGAVRENSVLVGDTKYDVAGAQRVGIPCIGVEYGYAAPGELLEAGVTALARDTKELKKLLME